MHRGYVKLWRKTLESSLWKRKNKNAFIVFIYCLLRANHRDESVPVGINEITIVPGEFVTSIQTIADECRISFKEARNAISHLARMKEAPITVKTTSQCSIISVKNWDLYQTVKDFTGNTVEQKRANKTDSQDVEIANSYASIESETGKAGAKHGQSMGKGGATNKNDKNERMKEPYPSTGSAFADQREDDDPNFGLLQPEDEFPVLIDIHNDSKSPFERWWKEYPRKIGKKKAREVWRRKKLDSIVEQLIVDVVKRRKNHGPWLDGYVPHATTYLNGERWDDEIEPRKQSGSGNVDRAKEILRRSYNHGGK